MTAPLTRAEIAAIAERDRAATPGPWVPFDSDPLCPFPAEIEYQRSFKISTPDGEDPRSAGMDPEDMNLPIATVDRYEKSDREAYANRDFICGARSDIPALLTDNTALRHALVELASAVNALALAQRLQPDGDGTALQARLTAALRAAEAAVGLQLPGTREG